MKFSLLICLALSCLTTAGAAEPKPITVKVGQKFKLTLKCNPTTGYQWVLAKPLAEKLLKLQGSEYQRLDPKLIGSGGNQVWTFQALAEGKTEIGLNYLRSWEKDVKPVEVTNYVVVIKAPKAPSKKKAPAPAGI